MDFAFRPRLASTVAMAVAVAVLLALGTWQMFRFFEKSEAEAKWSQRRSAEAVPVKSLDELDPEAMEQQKVELHGSIDPSVVAVFRHQRWAGQPGCWLASPLELDGGGTLLAVRGFVPLARPGKCDVENADFEPATTWTALVHTPTNPFVDASGRQSESGPRTRWESFDVEGAYAAHEIDDGPTTATVAILDERHSARPFPAASFEHVTDQYLTSMRHLNYAGTWYFSIFVVLTIWGFVSLERLPEDA